MYSYSRAILYAILLWAMTLLAAFFIYPLRTDDLMLFASIRMVLVTLFSMALTIMYFRDVEEHLIREGIKLGVIWLVVTVALDQGPFVWGLMQLSFVDYLADTGLSHLVYPVVTIGAGVLLSADKSTVEDSESSGRLSSPLSPTPPAGKKDMSGPSSKSKVNA